MSEATSIVLLIGAVSACTFIFQFRFFAFATAASMAARARSSDIGGACGASKGILTGTKIERISFHELQRSTRHASGWQRAMHGWPTPCWTYADGGEIALAPHSIAMTNRRARQLRQKRDRLALRVASQALQPRTPMTRGSGQ
jgi:hypothetical protein